MGAPKSDYERVAPKNSFIHVDDFKTVEGMPTCAMEMCTLIWVSLSFHNVCAYMVNSH